VSRNNQYKDAQTNGTAYESFEQKVIMINSISELQNVLSDEGNEKLALILEKGSLDYALTFIIGEQAKSVGTMTYTKWYKSNVTGADGIWVGTGISDQYLFKVGRTTAEMRDDEENGFGFSFINGKPVKIKMLTSDIDEDNSDE